MTDESRVVLTVLAAAVYLGFAALALRSARHAARVAAQWGNEEADGWRNGKIKIVVGVIGIFVATQQALPLDPVWRLVIFFVCLGLLVWGEFDMGTAFLNVANAQDRFNADADAQNVGHEHRRSGDPLDEEP